MKLPNPPTLLPMYLQFNMPASVLQDQVWPLPYNLAKHPMDVTEVRKFRETLLECLGEALLEALEEAVGEALGEAVGEVLGGMLGLLHGVQLTQEATHIPKWSIR